MNAKIAPPATRGHGFPVLADPDLLAAAIARLVREDAVSLPLLPPEACTALVEEGRALTLRPARPVVGEGAAAVYQDFELTMDIPPGSRFRGLAAALEDLIAAASGRIDPPPLDGPFRINDLVLQRYPAGGRGITPHRDHMRYAGLVAIVVLAGRGRFSVCANRAGDDAREIASLPGNLVLMRGPGLFGRSDRPFHMLSNVAVERWSFGMRHDTRAGG